MKLKAVLMICAIAALVSCNKDDDLETSIQQMEIEDRSINNDISNLKITSQALMRDPTGNATQYIDLPVFSFDAITNMPSDKFFLQSIETPNGATYDPSGQKILNPIKMIDNALGKEIKIVDNSVTLDFNNTSVTKDVSPELINSTVPGPTLASPFSNMSGGGSDGGPSISLAENITNLTSIGYTVSETLNEFIFVSPSLGISNSTGNDITITIHIDKVTEKPTRSIRKDGNIKTFEIKYDEQNPGIQGASVSSFDNGIEILKSTFTN